VVERALQTTHKGDRVAKSLLAVLNAGGGLGDCLVAGGGLPAVALAWARQRGLPLFVPVLSLPGAPQDVERRPHPRCRIAAAQGKHLWTIDDRTAVYWNTESGVPGQAARYPKAPHPTPNMPKRWQVSPEGNLQVLTEQSQFIVWGPKSPKPLTKLDLRDAARRQAEAEGIEVAEPYGLQISVRAVDADWSRCACEAWISDARTGTQEHRILIVSLPGGKLVSAVGPEKIDAEGWTLDSELPGYVFGENNARRGPHQLQGSQSCAELFDVVEMSSGVSIGVVAVPRRHEGRGQLPVLAVTSDGAMVLGTDNNDPSDTLLYRQRT
jgi:hypothetical protein